jgi:methyltransferase (TIGR00027 family)
MVNKGVEQKPSESALIAALRRAMTNQQYSNSRLGPDFLAVVFLPPHYQFFLKFKKIQTSTRGKLDAFFPGMTEFIIARTIWFDGLFVDALKQRVPQIVLLGAGYDSRAYRFAALNQGTRIFELDITPTQERKISCLKKAKIEIPPSVAFIPIDFNRDPLKDTLEKAGWRNDQKTLFIWEGVSYYLDPASVDATLRFFSHSTSHESLIAFDYAITLNQGNIADYYGAKEFLKSMQEQQANEELTFSIEAGKLESFLISKSLKLVEHLDNEAIEKKFLTGDESITTGRIPGFFRFISASPK